jgi:signal transduction histidine kinase
MTSVFLIDPVAERRTGTERYLTTGGFHVIASSGSERSPLHRLPGTTAVLVIFDEAHGQTGLALVASRRSQDSDLPVIVAGEHLDPPVAAAILEHDASCLSLTAPVEAWYPVLHRLIEQTARTSQLNRKVTFLEKKLTLVGSVTRHDVLNQLTAVTGYNELLEMIITDQKMRSFIEKERASLGKIRNQFQYAKDYQNLGTEPPHCQKISSVVRRASDMYDLKSIRIEDSCGEVAVFADALLEKAFACLVENTLQFGEKATVIRVYVKTGPGEPVLVIEDDGVGITADDKEKIFERGFGKNTGWGLFLVREILAVTGIRITETGTPGMGARFELKIPPDYFRR